MPLPLAYAACRVCEPIASASLRRARHRHRPRERHLDLDPLRADVRAVAPRHARYRHAADRRRRERTARNLVARAVRHRVPAQPQNRVRRRARPTDRTAVQRQRARPDAQPVRVRVRLPPPRTGTPATPCPSPTRSPPAASPLPDRQAPAAACPSPSTAALNATVATIVSPRSNTSPTTGAPIDSALTLGAPTPAVHLVRRGVAEHARRRAQPRSRPARARVDDRAAVQRQSARAQADPVRVHVRSLPPRSGTATASCRSRSRRTPAASRSRSPAPAAGVPVTTTVRWKQHIQLDPLAQLVRAVARRRAPNNNVLHRQTREQRAVHLVIRTVRNRVRTQPQNSVQRRARRTDRTAVQRQRARTDADPVHVPVRLHHHVAEQQRVRARARRIRSPPRLRTDPQRQLAARPSRPPPC